MTSLPSDGGHVQLVIKARADDRRAFGELYQRFARAVHGVLITRVPSQDTDDLVQDVFIHAWPRMRELREPAAFGGWICTIARRRALDHHRRARNDDELTDTVASPDRPDVTADASAALAAIRDLHCSRHRSRRMRRSRSTCICLSRARESRAGARSSSSTTTRRSPRTSGRNLEQPRCSAWFAP